MDKVTKLKELMTILNDSIGKTEFSNAFKSLVDFVKKVEKDLAFKIDSKTQEAEKELEEMNQLYKNTIQKIEADNETTLSNVKKWALESVGKLFAKSKINEKLNEIDSALNRANNLTLPDASMIAQEAAQMAQDELLPLIPAKIVLEEELPKLGEPIRDALELLQDDERLDKSAIKGLQEELDRILKIAESKTAVMGGGGVGKQNVYYYDLTDQLNGVTTVFSLPAFARILKVETFSGAVLRPLVDWTADANAHTLTFTIDAETYLATGQTCLVYYSI